MHNTDWEVVSIDSLRHMGLDDRLVEAGRDHPEWIERTTFLYHDLCAPISDMLAKKIGPVDYIINLASLSDVHASIEDPVPFIKNNVDLSLSMLEYARKVKPIAFVQVSTDEVYGPTDGAHLHKEWDPIVPSNAYSASKAAQESCAIAYWRSYDVPLIIINMMNNFGEMQSSNKFPAIIQRKINKGEPITVHGSPEENGSRCYIHSRNAADAILFLLQGDVPHLHQHGTQDKPDRYNLVGDEQLTNFDLVAKIGNLMWKKYEIMYTAFNKARPGHDQHYGLDGSKLRNRGWRSPLTLDESLQATVDWQQSHREWLE
jgi:dTDP-glucose 4,6-dehydratase